MVEFGSICWFIEWKYCTYVDCNENSRSHLSAGVRKSESERQPSTLEDAGNAHALQRPRVLQFSISLAIYLWDGVFP